MDQGQKVLGVSDLFNTSTLAIKNIFSITSIIDVIIVAVLFYWFYLFLRQTRALGILYGIAILAFLWLISQWLELIALKTVLRWFVTSILVAIPVVFQPELRSALEKLGTSTKYVTDWRRLSKFEVDAMIDEVLKAVRLLSKNQIGALIVFSRQSGLVDIISSGEKLFANLNHKLLTNIFTPKAPLHDGAVIISANKIIAASCTLPLSDEVTDLSLGTRHKAAISLTSLTDALALVVSEETGMVSFSVSGRLQRNLNLKELKEVLSKHLRVNPYLKTNRK